MPRRTAVLALALNLLLVPVTAAESPHGQLELETKSEFSRIRIRQKNNVRSLIFVRDSGEEALETQVDLRNPHELLVAYTRYMFLSYLFRAQQEKVLIVGLGGGAMVHFLKHYDPRVEVDAVEIDPAIVRVADEYFGIRGGGNVNIITADAFDYIPDTKSRYDAIYMDAFLKPSRDTDSTGVPFRLRTLEFYRTISSKLTPGGVVVFNLNPHPGVRRELNTLREAFPQIYAFTMTGSKGLVVVASMSRQRVASPDIATRAKELDERFETSFSFRTMVRRVRR